jgi:hypothetical protein
VKRLTAARQTWRGIFDNAYDAHFDGEKESDAAFSE